MTNRVVRNVSIGALLAVCSAAMGVDKAGSLPAATQELLQMYPGAQVFQEGGRIKMIYGMPMTAGQNAASAAESFVLLHSEAFGMGTIELAPAWAADTADGMHSIYSYNEKIDGYPVELGDIRVMVLNGQVPRVVYAGGNLAPRPEGGFTPATVTSELAAAIAQSCKEGAALDVWYDQPQLVVFQGNGDWISPVLTWKYTGDSKDLSARGTTEGATRTFFIDAHTGQIVHVRIDVSHTDVGGTVKAMGTGGLDPDIATNPPVLMNMPEIKVGIAGGNTAFSDRNGVFSIVNAGTAAVTLNSSIGAAGGFGGRWVSVVPTGATGITATQAGVTPPGPGSLTFNSVPGGVNSLTTAQVNAFVYANTIHNYFKDRAPTSTILDQVLPANTAVAGTCNAFFSGSTGVYPCTNCTINFYNAGGGCNNTSYGNVIMHEYGHFIVNRLNRAQNSFGEGYGDTCAMLIQDDTIVGRNFFTSGAAVRTPMTVNAQYPCTVSGCSAEVHCCGQVIASTWYQMRLNMGAALGSATGLDVTRQLHVKWSLITTGSSSSLESLQPANVQQMYVADDNDGNLLNGTPHYAQICAAVTAHKGTMTTVQACPTITQVCYANCDASTTAPVLTANDFQCFLNAFAANASYANCDNSTTPPTLTANDFQCFLNAYAAGCT